MSVPAIEEGIHKIPDAEYFAIDLPSSSATKVLINGTNAHLAHERREPREENDAFTLGAYVHALLLDPDSIETNFIRLGEINRRTTVGKEAWESAQRRAETSGARVITRDLVQQADAMAESVRANQSAAALLRCLTHREITIIGTIGEDRAKCKVDGIVEDGASCVLLDIKTTESASVRDFANSAAKFGYFHQAAFYRRLAEQHIAVVDDFVIVAVEKKAPYLCAVFRVSSMGIEIADRLIDQLVSRWWDVKRGDNTGYSMQVQDLDPPRWWSIPE